MSLVRYKGLLAIPQEIGAEASSRGHRSAMMKKKAKTSAEQDDDEEVTLPENPGDTHSGTDDLPWDELEYESRLAVELAKLSTTSRPAKFRLDSNYSVVLINPVTKLQFRLNFDAAEEIEANDSSSLFAIDASRMKRGISQSCFNAPVSQAELNALDLGACHILFPEFITRDLDVRTRAMKTDPTPDSPVKALQQRLKLFKDIRIACDKSINKLQSEIHDLEASDTSDTERNGTQPSEPSIPDKPALQELFEDITSNMLNPHDQDKIAAALHSHTMSMMEYYRQGLVCMALHCKKVSKEIETRFRRLVETLFAIQEEIRSYGNFELTPSKVVNLTEGLHVCTCESCTAIPAGGAMKAEYERRMASKLLAGAPEVIDLQDDSPTAANTLSRNSTEMSNQRLFAVISELKGIVVEMDCPPSDALSRYNEQMEQYQRSITTPKRSIAEVDRPSIDVAVQDGKFPLPPTLEQINMLVASGNDASEPRNEVGSLDSSTKLTPETANGMLAALSKTFPDGPSTPSQESLIDALRSVADGNASQRMYHFSIGNGDEEDMMNDAEKSVWKSGAMSKKQIASTEQLYNQNPSVYMSPAEEALYFRLRRSAPLLPPVIIEYEEVGEDLNVIGSIKTVARFARPDDDEYKNKHRDAPPPYEHFLMSINDIEQEEKDEEEDCSFIDYDSFFKILNTFVFPGNNFRPPFDVLHKPLCTDESFNIQDYWESLPRGEAPPMTTDERAMLQKILDNGVEPEDAYRPGDDEATQARKRKSRIERARNCKGNMPVSTFEGIFQRMRAYPDEDFTSDGQYAPRAYGITTSAGTKVDQNASKFIFNGNWDVKVAGERSIPADEADEYMLSLSHSKKRVGHQYVKQLAQLRINVYKAGIKWLEGRLERMERDNITDLSKELQDTKQKSEWAEQAQGKIEELCLKYPRSLLRNPRASGQQKTLDADANSTEIHP